MKYVKVTNLPKNSSSASIRDGLYHEFKKYGGLTALAIKEDKKFDRYAVVCYKNSKDAASACEETDNTRLLGECLKVDMMKEGELTEVIPDGTGIPRNLPGVNVDSDTIKMETEDEEVKRSRMARIETL